jgi:hypothetical protein
MCYIPAQCAGAVRAAIVAHLMFGLPAISVSGHARSGSAQAFSEFVATFGLICVIWGCTRQRSDMVAFAVAAYITAAYWFTSSTSFANPAVTIARSLSDTFAGIRPADVPPFVVAQLAGAIAAALLFRWLIPRLDTGAEQILIPSEPSAGLNGSMQHSSRTQLTLKTKAKSLARSAGTLPWLGFDRVQPNRSPLPGKHCRINALDGVASTG